MSTHFTKFVATYHPLLDDQLLIAITYVHQTSSAANPPLDWHNLSSIVSIVGVTQ